MKVLKGIPVVLTVVSMLIIQSCDDDHTCVHGEGSIVSQERSLPGFSGINFETEGTVYLSQGPETSFRVEAQQNVINDMITEVNGGELTIYNDHCLKNHLPITVYITSPDISNIRLSGTGALYTETSIVSDEINVVLSGSGNIFAMDSLIATNMSCEISGSGSVEMTAYCSSLTSANSGSGNISITGKAGHHEYDQSGSGELRSFSLETGTTIIELSGSGNAEVLVNDLLDVTISGSGDVLYKGSPIVNTTISGSGQVIHVN